MSTPGADLTSVGNHFEMNGKRLVPAILVLGFGPSERRGNKVDRLGAEGDACVPFTHTHT